ncbi:MAG: NAD-dependent epimerase/dehydratase family protein [Hyphomicrobiales bacterium]|nr:NAD-dependent epimerase/dehydratase family protein [Hyphomicrobiales bacterium]
MRVLITGSAGFIGFHVARRLLSEGHTVFGVDGITPYYDPDLKRQRHALLAGFSSFTPAIVMLEDAAQLADCVRSGAPEIAIHLAAQAGVRDSAENPRAYIDSNVVGTFNLLQALKDVQCRHLIVASTSSVYSADGRTPLAEDQATDQPISLYAATKKATELFAYQHSRATAQPVTVIRPFTVYGPWGRPDMAMFKFTRHIAEGIPIDVHGRGRMARDFTYIDDAVEAIRCLMEVPPDPPFRIVNVGGGQPVALLDFIALIETTLGRKAIRRDLPMQPGELPATCASTELLERLIGFKPRTPIAVGVAHFVDWYRRHYRL